MTEQLRRPERKHLFTVTFGEFTLDMNKPPISIPKASQTELDFEIELNSRPEPFERKIMKQLARSLQIVQTTDERVYSNEMELDYFFTVVSEGVSANLCEAIVEIDKSGEFKGVDIKLSWSPIIEISDDFPTAIFIRRNIIPIIESAATKLKSIFKENFGGVLKLLDQKIG